MLMVEIRRSLDATHPDRAAQMMDALECLVRTCPMPVLTLPANHSAHDSERAAQWIDRLNVTPRPALVAVPGWDFKWVAPRAARLSEADVLKKLDEKLGALDRMVRALRESQLSGGQR